MKAARRRSNKPESWTKIARERIEILLSLAEKEVRKHPDRAERYVELARKIGMRYNIRPGRHAKMRFCSRCNTFLVPGLNCRVRTSKDRQALVITCGRCGSVKRYPYGKEKKG